LTIKIFICYSQDDFRARGRKLYNYLSKHIPDSDVYIDQLKTKGDNWREINDQNLINSHIVIVILTPAALKSSEVEREVKISKDSDKIIIPCNDDNTDLSWEEIPWELGTKEGIEFEDDEILKTRLYKEIKKARKNIPEDKHLEYVVEKISERMNDNKSYSIDAIVVKKGSVPIIINNQVMNLPFTIKKGLVEFLSTKIDTEALSVIFNVVCNEDATVDLTLPRSLIDSKKHNDDDQFFVLVDGNEVTFKETKSNTTDRIITISISTSSQFVEIIGTQLLGISFTGVTKPENVVKILRGASSRQGIKYLEPELLTIKQGEKVKWENTDNASHTITSGNPSDAQTGTIFDSGLFATGKSFELTFNEKGSYSYYCQVHPWEIGKVTVNPILKDSKIVEPTFDKEDVLLKLDSIIETHAKFAEKKSQLNFAIKQYDECCTLVKKIYPARSDEIEILKIKMPSIVRQLLSSPAIEFQSTKENLLEKAKRLRNIIESAE